MAQVDALRSWKDTKPKQAILKFVERVTTEGSPDFVPPADRIAVFDNDGTLWVEQPAYTQFLYAFSSVKERIDQHPELGAKEPYRTVVAGGLKGVLAKGEKGLVELVATTHSGMSTDTFALSVSDWLATAIDPRFKKRYDELYYLPMRELLDYLRTNGFKTFIVSGGGVEFIRSFAEPTYGIPPEQVVGSSGVTEFQINAAGEAELIKQPKVEFVDDGPGKPVGINRFIGKRPIFAFGNSDGDLQMLQWTASTKGPYFAGIVHHTDAEREYAYDRDSSVGKLDKALDAASAGGWTVVDMKNDWSKIFTFER